MKEQYSAETANLKDHIRKVLEEYWSIDYCQMF